MEALSGAMRDAHAMVEAGRGKGMQGWMTLPYDQEEVLSAIEKTAARVRDEFESFVVLGHRRFRARPGGRASGAQAPALQRAAKEKRGGPRLYIEDNVDPERMAALLDVIDLKTTCFNVITKSAARLKP